MENTSKTKTGRNSRSLKFAFGLLAVLAIAGCTDNQRARTIGCSVTRQLPAGQKLVCVSWKNDDIWITTRPMRIDEKAETYTMQEDASWGVLNGTVTIVEARNGNHD